MRLPSSKTIFGQLPSALRYAAFVLPPLLLIACGPPTVYAEERPLPSAGWAYADSVRFAFTIPSTEQAYDLVLSLDHDADFPTQNLYVRIHTEFPSGKRRSEEVSLQLAGTFGEWNGDCGGERCAFEVPILRNARFEDAGAYALTVEQFSRSSPLPGVSSVGLRVVEATP